MNRSQIEQIEIDAGTAGDLVQAALCQIALTGDVRDETFEALTERQREQLTWLATGGTDSSCEWDRALVMRAIRSSVPAESIRHGSFGPIVWGADGSTRAATQADMDDLPVGPDLTEEEEASIEE